MAGKVARPRDPPKGERSTSTTLYLAGPAGLQILERHFDQYKQMKRDVLFQSRRSTICTQRKVYPLIVTQVCIPLIVHTAGVVVSAACPAETRASLALTFSFQRWVRKKNSLVSYSRQEDEVGMGSVRKRLSKATVILLLVTDGRMLLF
jgi:hypothetical protein